MSARFSPGARLLAAALLLMLAAGASFAPAAADSVRVGDAGDHDPPDNYDYITSAQFSNASKRVVVRARLRDYWPPNHTDWRLFVHTRADRDGKLAEYMFTMGVDGLELTRFRDDKAVRIDCPGLAYENSSMSAPGVGWVQMSIPRSCLVHTQQARFLFTDGLIEWVPNLKGGTQLTYTRWIDRG